MQQTQGGRKETLKAHSFPSSNVELSPRQHLCMKDKHVMQLQMWDAQKQQAQFMQMAWMYGMPMPGPGPSGWGKGGGSSSSSGGCIPPGSST
eukprot:878508-Amphidinium_carterae.1